MLWSTLSCITIYKVTFSIIDDHYVCINCDHFESIQFINSFSIIGE